MEELLTIYEWPEKLLNKELKKLTLQQKLKSCNIQRENFGSLKCLSVNDRYDESYTNFILKNKS